MAAEMERINVDSEEMISSDVDDVEQPSTWTPRRFGFVAVGLTAFVAIGMAAAALVQARQPAASPKHTARALLESDELIKAVAKNQMDILKLKANKVDVQHQVVTGLKKVERELEANEPARWRELNGLEISPEQKDAIVRMVSSIGDARVQEVGRKVAKACSDGRSEGRAGVTRRLKDTFKKEELLKIRQLRNELFHGLREEASAESDVSFDVDSLRILKALDVESAQKNRRLMFDFADDLKEGQDDEESKDDTSLLSPGSMGSQSEMEGDSDTMTQALDFFGGIAEQTRVALDQIDFVGTSFGWDSQVPAAAKSAVGGASFFTNLADCVSRADGNNVKEGMCPFKYGSSAFDMISCVDNLLGVSNARMGVDNPGGYDIWDDFFGSPTPSTATAGASSLFSPSPSTSSSSNIFDSFFSSPAPAPAGTTANTNGLFSWTG